MSRLTMNSRLRQVRNCAYQTIDQETFIVQPVRRLMHRLNETGAEIWNMLRRPTVLRDVVDHVCTEFDVDASTARRDTLAFLRELREKDLVESCDNEDA